MIRCRDGAPLPGREWASHVFGAFQCAVRGPIPFSGCLLVAASYVEFYLLYTRSSEIFLTMLLTSSNESQAVLGHLFFSPSAATLCRRTPDPILSTADSPSSDQAL